MIAQALYTKLKFDTALAARVGSRIYPVRVPQDATYPALSYFRASTHTFHAHHGASGIAAPLFQVSVWAKGTGGALVVEEIADLVRLALDGFKGFVAGETIHGIFLRNQHDFYEDDTEIYHRPMDFEVWHAEAA